MFRGKIVNDHFIPVLRGNVRLEAGSNAAAIEIEMVQSVPNPKFGLTGWTVAGEANPEQLRLNLAAPK